MPIFDELEKNIKSDTTDDPPSDAEEFYRHSLVNVLKQAQGYFVVCEFIIGTAGLEAKEGVLFDVGINFVTLKDPNEERFTICDLYSLKFITVFDTKTRPRSLMNQGQRYNNNMRQR